MKKDKKKFIQRSIIFLVVLIIGVFTINQLYFQVIVPQKNIQRAQNQFDNAVAQGDIKVLILGDSHAARSLNPQEMNKEMGEKSFNYALPGENYIQTEAKVKKVLKEQKGIDTYILPLDIHSFSDYRNNPYSDTWFWIDFFPAKELSILTQDSVAKILIKSKIPWLGGGLEFLRLIDNNKQTVIQNGWQEGDGVFDTSKNKQDVARKRIERQLQQSNHIIIQKHLWSAFVRTLELLEDQNKTIVLIRYPITKEYTQALEEKGIDAENYYEKIFNEIKEYKNIIIIDKHNWNNENGKLYSDPDHLNKNGARIFSKEIGQELNRIIQANNRTVHM